MDIKMSRKKEKKNGTMMKMVRELGELLPSSMSNRFLVLNSLDSKLETLESAIRYIKHLQEHTPESVSLLSTTSASASTSPPLDSNGTHGGDATEGDEKCNQNKPRTGCCQFMRLTKEARDREFKTGYQASIKRTVELIRQMTPSSSSTTDQSNNSSTATNGEETKNKPSAPLSVEDFTISLVNSLLSHLDTTIDAQAVKKEEIRKVVIEASTQTEEQSNKWRRESPLSSPEVIAIESSQSLRNIVAEQKKLITASPASRNPSGRLLEELLREQKSCHVIQRSTNHSPILAREENSSPKSSVTTHSASTSSSSSPTNMVEIKEQQRNGHGVKRGYEELLRCNDSKTNGQNETTKATSPPVSGFVSVKKQFLQRFDHSVPEAVAPKRRKTLSPSPTELRSQPPQNQIQTNEMSRTPLTDSEQDSHRDPRLALRATHSSGSRSSSEKYLLELEKRNEHHHRLREEQFIKEMQSRNQVSRMSSLIPSSHAHHQHSQQSSRVMLRMHPSEVPISYHYRHVPEMMERVSPHSRSVNDRIALKEYPSHAPVPVMPRVASGSPIPPMLPSPNPLSSRPRSRPSSSSPVAQLQHMTRTHFSSRESYATANRVNLSSRGSSYPSSLLPPHSSPSLSSSSSLHQLPSHSLSLQSPLKPSKAAHSSYTSLPHGSSQRVYIHPQQQHTQQQQVRPCSCSNHSPRPPSQMVPSHHHHHSHSSPHQHQPPPAHEAASGIVHVTDPPSPSSSPASSSPSPSSPSRLVHPSHHLHPQHPRRKDSQSHLHVIQAPHPPPPPLVAYSRANTIPISHPVAPRLVVRERREESPPTKKPPPPSPLPPSDPSLPVIPSSSSSSSSPSQPAHTTWSPSSRILFSGPLSSKNSNTWLSPQSSHEVIAPAKLLFQDKPMLRDFRDTIK